jgi:hypothetical protein
VRTVRGQEILSGGQRIHLPEVLEARLRRKGIDPASPGIKEYVDVFKSAGGKILEVISPFLHASRAYLYSTCHAFAIDDNN